MENATKALIITGTVLISVLVLSVGVYLFKNYSEFAYRNEQKQEKQALIQYNTKFEKFIDKTMNIQDVVTIANLANDYNNRELDNKISVSFLGSDILKNINTNENWAKLLENNKDKNYKIKNDKFEYYEDGTIKKIEIVEKK